MKHTLKLNNNFLKGSIPTQIGNLHYMEYGFYLQSNLLSGSIPTEFAVIGSQNGLQYDVQINDNRLSGQVPSEFGMLNKLTGYFALQNNELCDDLPEEVMSMYTNTTAEVTLNWNFDGNSIGTECGHKHKSGGSDDDGQAGVIAGAVIGSFFGLLLVCFLLYKFKDSITLPSMPSMPTMPSIPGLSRSDDLASKDYAAANSNTPGTGTLDGNVGAPLDPNATGADV